MFINYVIDRLYLPKIIKSEAPDLIIADNRFGIYSRKIKSIIISHHLNIQMPEGLEIFGKIVTAINCFFISRFSQLWIPDFDGQPNLSGRLSHQHKCHHNYKFIGFISRFNHTNCQPDKTYDIVCLVSGLDPQRQIFVDKLTEIFSKTNYKTLIISGRPEKDFNIKHQNITIVSHLDDLKFCKYVKGAKAVIIRGGYSTIMDLVALGRTAVNVPTPRQTEQEYLAKHLNQQGLFLACAQNDFNLGVVSEFLIKQQSMADKINRLKEKASDYLRKNILN